MRKFKICGASSDLVIYGHSSLEVGARVRDMQREGILGFVEDIIEGARDEKISSNSRGQSGAKERREKTVKRLPRVQEKFSF